MILFSNSKINIGLNIINKREDGYHNIETCFAPIGWSDILEIIPSDKLIFSTTGIPIPGNTNENLCLKAYYIIARNYKIPPVKIHLHKIVPIGAGLGGGSSNAAFVLKGLNQMFELGIKEPQLIEYASTMGSDCAFFVKNKLQFATGKGDDFSDLSVNVGKKYLTLIYPNFHISTPEAYKGCEPRGNSYNLSLNILQPISEWRNLIQNDFEKTILLKYPVLQNIKNELYKKGAIYASMSGSGSTMFGVFEFEPNIDDFISDNYLVWKEQITF
ncbi:MAG: 4-(cytidine 5'-diphospho)-2-C-methyl-D-erythritol kinase [Bacteroidota bacterium]|nr:4-(cytidine 5'-diphospho)-2-C-methyl-D-erythritol kinase [Bacteroidota bacterium]